eukprot:g55028.t1
MIQTHFYGNGVLLYVTCSQVLNLHVEGKRGHEQQNAHHVGCALFLVVVTSWSFSKSFTENRRNCKKRSTQKANFLARNLSHDLSKVGDWGRCVNFLRKTAPKSILGPVTILIVPFVPGFQQLPACKPKKQHKPTSPISSTTSTPTL